jgi:hypothetical protein
MLWPEQQGCPQPSLHPLWNPDQRQMGSRAAPLRLGAGSASHLVSSVSSVSAWPTEGEHTLIQGTPAL